MAIERTTDEQRRQRAIDAIEQERARQDAANKGPGRGVAPKNPSNTSSIAPKNPDNRGNLAP
jgi:hypothetical protein